MVTCIERFSPEKFVVPSRLGPECNQVNHVHDWYGRDSWLMGSTQPSIVILDLNKAIGMALLTSRDEHVLMYLNHMDWIPLICTSFSVSQVWTDYGNFEMGWTVSLYVWFSLCFVLLFADNKERSKFLLALIWQKGVKFQHPARAVCEATRAAASKQTSNFWWHLRARRKFWPLQPFHKEKVRSQPNISKIILGFITSHYIINIIKYSNLVRPSRNSSHFSFKSPVSQPPCPMVTI